MQTSISRVFIVSAYLFQVGIWPFTRFVLYFFGHMKVSGLENLKKLPRKKGIIFASNHSSELDPFITPASLPWMSPFIPLFYTIRDKSFYDESGVRQILYGGFLFRLIGGQYVYGGLKDYEKSLVRHTQLLQQGKNIFIFPEGGISRIGRPREAKGGIAFLAEKTGAPIVPVAISGLYGVSVSDFLKEKARIHVVFGTPISQQDIKMTVHREKQEDPVVVYKREAQYVMDAITRMIQ